MWPSGASSSFPCPRDSALRKSAFSGNLSALPSHLIPTGRSVRVFISANPEGKPRVTHTIPASLNITAAAAQPLWP
ncbi:hypothetical protein XELAEV_18005200mg [Xenopus laevis]|uniref:Uncharacterized protein n=1 Tax=Xenopus laevis TaxID=8355 RepID=A0A974DXL8_XENLA|nr:hypothetical protein XELAEV_18005200mg [Xenopus laevis]